MLAQEGRLQQWTMPHPTIQAPMRPPCDLQRTVLLARHVYFHDGLCAFWKGNGVNCLKAGPEQAVAFAARQFYLSTVAKDPSKPTFVENFAVGAGAGCTAQALLYPMEVVKTRMAVGKHGEYNSIADCIVQSYRRGGLRDLYRGMLANMAGILPHRGLEMGSFFSLDQAATQAYGGAPPLYVTMVCSFVASLFSQVVTYPLNLARTRLQTQGVNGRPRLYDGLWHCLTTVVRCEGPGGLFVGLLPNMLKAVPASMLMYITFRRVQLALDESANQRTI
jgi:solute carrier family 25 phosphate transporter 23/24/25/41